ncbi:m7gpppn-mRNA hydrolase [Anaeramoeba flamelloides]|uniref:M7gpppn-mRNA hydrolase n=1 Tax=Anaeramoeba flamelloides TaxID=1746091 RepID=A0AAV8ADZ5_9EUKA|nr:m7gpppn-mRNA hydrolase [Anaeramoeba flamelloides]KAJ6254400.1 m7gpppn-mRNA hydrolase [Anaeramoeba flamelloides]
MTRELQVKIFKDLLSRFVINTNYNEENWEIDLIENMRKSLWFYKDFYQKEYAHLPNLTLEKICREMFRLYKPLKQRKEGGMIQKHKKYRNKQPKCGSILLTPDLKKVLLVLGVGNGKKLKGKWGFPKGTLESCDENPMDCVIRETREEIGYDLTGKILDKNCLKKKVNSTFSYMYIITDVNPKQEFYTETRNEIQKIQWFPIDKVPLKETNMVFSKHYPALLNWIKFKKSKRSNGGGFKIDLTSILSNSNQVYN